MKQGYRVYTRPVINSRPGGLADDRYVGTVYESSATILAVVRELKNVVSADVYGMDIVVYVRASKP